MRALILALLLASPLSGQSVYGITLCIDGQPMAFVNVDVRNPAQVEATRVHERQHVRNARRVGCEAWEADTTTAGIIADEASAFCAEARASADPAKAVRTLGADLARYYPELVLTKSEAIAAIEAACKP